MRYLLANTWSEADAWRAQHLLESPTTTTTIRGIDELRGLQFGPGDYVVDLIDTEASRQAVELATRVGAPNVVQHEMGPTFQPDKVVDYERAMMRVEIPNDRDLIMVVVRDSLNGNATFIQLDDSALFDGRSLNTLQRRVLAARFHHWAEVLDNVEEIHNHNGERIR